MTRFAALKADIDHELRNLKRLAKELDDILTATKERSIARTRAVGSLLHDFYTGVEKIFSQIAIKIDQDLPAGEGWHIQLLKRMTIPIEGIRPQVIDEKLENDLEEYLRFRHLFWIQLHKDPLSKEKSKLRSMVRIDEDRIKGTLARH
jgi:hypothetical protein